MPLGIPLMNKTDKNAIKAVKEIKEKPVNPIPDNSTAAELIRRRRTK
jgi:hypothetical protein